MGNNTTAGLSTDISKTMYEVTNATFEVSGEVSNAEAELEIDDDLDSEQPPKPPLTFRTYRSDADISLYQNYELIPSNVLHKIMLYLNLQDLSVIFRTCKLFLFVGNTDLFWRNYFSLLSKSITSKNIKLDPRLKISKDNKESEEEYNFKKKVFHLTRRKYGNYIDCDEYYQKIYNQTKSIRKLNQPSHNKLLKIVVFGARCGKSCFVLSFKRGYYDDPNTSTIGVEFYTRLVYYRGDCIRLQMWDTSGQERFSQVSKGYLKSCDGLLFCFDITSSESLDQMIWNWVPVYQKALEEEISDPCLMICGLKKDLEDKDREVGQEDVESRLQKIENFPMEKICFAEDYCESSSKKFQFVSFPYLRLMEKILMKQSFDEQNETE